MTTRVYTAADLLAYKPCDNTKHHWYTRIPSLVGDGVTARQIAEYAEAPVEDRRWILTRLLYSADPRQLVLWAVDCALSVRHLITAEDEDTRDAADCAIQTAVALTEGEATQEECRRAADATYYATRTAAAAAYAAARAAADAADAAADAADATYYAADSARAACVATYYAAVYAADAAPAPADAATARAAADADAETTLLWLVDRLESL